MNDYSFFVLVLVLLFVVLIIGFVYLVYLEIKKMYSIVILKYWELYVYVKVICVMFYNIFEGILFFKNLSVNFCKLKFLKSVFDIKVFIWIKFCNINKLIVCKFVFEK